jgi:hypothetical protein
MKGARRQNAGKMSPVRRVGMDIRRGFDISGQIGRACDDAVVEPLSHQRGFRFLTTDGTVDDAAKRHSCAFDDAIGARVEQDRNPDHGKISVPPRIFLE